MALDAKTSVGVGLGTMGLVWGVYGQMCPSLPDLRSGEPNEANAAASEMAARWVSAALVTGVALITQDKTVFIMGALAVIAFSVLHRHANMVDPTMARAVMPSSRQTMHAGDQTTVTAY